MKGNIQKDKITESLKLEFKKKYLAKKRLNENVQEQFMPLEEFFSIWHHKVDEICEENNESSN